MIRFGAGGGDSLWQRHLLRSQNSGNVLEVLDDQSSRAQVFRMSENQIWSFPHLEPHKDKPDGVVTARALFEWNPRYLRKLQDAYSGSRLGACRS